MLGAVRATKDCSACFNTVADDPAAAMGAFGSQFVDGAFEAVEVMRDAIDHYFERFIVIIAAAFTLGSSWVQIKVGFTFLAWLHFPCAAAAC